MLPGREGAPWVIPAWQGDRFTEGGQVRVTQAFEVLSQARSDLQLMAELFCRHNAVEAVRTNSHMVAPSRRPQSTDTRSAMKGPLIVRRRHPRTGLAGVPPRIGELDSVTKRTS